MNNNLYIKGDIAIPPNLTNTQEINYSDNNKTICCIPFSYGKYKEFLFKGQENQHKGTAVYVFYNNTFGEFALDKITLELLWSTTIIPETLLIRIQKCLQSWKKHFGE